MKRNIGITIITCIASFFLLAFLAWLATIVGGNPFEEFISLMRKEGLNAYSSKNNIDLLNRGYFFIIFVLLPITSGIIGLINGLNTRNSEWVYSLISMTPIISIFLLYDINKANFLSAIICFVLAGSGGFLSMKLKRIRKRKS